jgi:uncharacterized protein (TIGR02996 family)
MSHSATCKTPEQEWPKNNMGGSKLDAIGKQPRASSWWHAWQRYNMAMARTIRRRMWSRFPVHHLLPLAAIATRPKCEGTPSMSDHQSFLAAIAANRADDLPRLIYADWLEDQGDPRCEFLRAKCSQDRAAAAKVRVDAEWELAVARQIGMEVVDGGDRCLDVIKRVKELTRLSLMDVKRLAGLPRPTRFHVTPDLQQALAFKASLEEVGAKIGLAAIW